jgi:hypothetical protein
MLVMTPVMVHMQMGILYGFVQPSVCTAHPGKKGAQREERYPKSPDHMTSSENEIDESRPLITAREIHGTLKWTERKPNPKLTRKRATAWSNQQHEMDNDTREKTGLKIHAAK